MVGSSIAFAGVSQTYNFTNAGASGQFGPTQAQVNTAYTATTLDGAVTVTTQGIQEWVVPTNGTYTITAMGACGGELQGTYFPGLPGTGATIEGDFFLTAGTTVYVVVGQKGIYGDNGSGGGGGSFVFTGAPGGAGLMIAAGGGGGHGHGSGSVPTGALGGGGSATQNQVDGMNGTGNGGSPGVGLGGNAGTGACSYTGLGAGGMGWTSDGASPVGCGASTGGSYMTFVGGNGGSDGLFGGFGGGGGSDGNGSPGGGGGGYTGGGGGNDFNGSAWGAGAGAGSYNNGSNQTNTPGVTGASSGFSHGYVTISLNCVPTTMTIDNPTLSTYTAECIGTPPTPTATNDCGTVYGTPDVTFPIVGTGTTTVTWTYDDGVTVLTQTQDVTLTADVTAPVVDNPSLTSYSAQCEFTSLPTPTATDACAGTVYGVPDVTFPITAQGVTIVTWTYDDGSGNTVSQQQQITLNDIAAPAPDVANLSDYMGCDSATPPAPTATDYCVGSINGTPDVTFPITTIGTTVVTWTYDDGHGNSVTQTQNVIVGTVDNGITANGTTLTANAGSATYEWMDCGTNMVIAGENGQSYTPTVTGNYAVIVTENGCTDTSACLLVDYTGLDELNLDDYIIYPNPNNGQFSIVINIDEHYNVKVQDVTGKVVYSSDDNSNENNIIRIDNIVAGTYYLTIEYQGYNRTKKMVVQ